MSVSAIVAHKMRSLLTMLGIIIGITSVVSVVALGNGSQQKILENIKGIGTNTMTIFNGTGFGDRRAEQMQNLTVNDANALSNQSYVQSVTPNSTSSGTLIYGNQTFSSTNLKGVSEQSFDVEGLTLKLGNTFTQEDIRNNQSVALIDESAKKSIFPHENPLGKIVMFNKRPLRIIGVVSDRQMGGASSSLNIYAPYSTVMNKISGSKKIASITVKVSDSVNSTVAEKGITELLKMRHGKKDFFIMNSDTIKQTIAYLLYRLYFLDRWWDWRDEHYVGIGDRTYERNRCAHGNRRKTIQHLATIFNRSGAYLFNRRGNWHSALRRYRIAV